MDELILHTYLTGAVLTGILEIDVKEAHTVALPQISLLDASAITVTGLLDLGRIYAQASEYFTDLRAPARNEARMTSAEKLAESPGESFVRPMSG